MNRMERYFTYLQEVVDGQRPAPEGIVLTETDPLRRAVEAQQAVAAMGVPEFVRRCAERDGTELDPSLFDGFSPEEVTQALADMLAQAPEDGQAPESTDAPAEDDTPHIEEPDGPRSAYEVLLDCCLLDENLLTYLIDTVRREAVEEFRKIALVTTRKAFDPADLIAWFVGKERRGDRDELICVTLMDAVFDRLAAEGQKELIAALLCGDRTTFELFRCDAPELLHFPDATYEWYEKNYLSRYYPVRYLMKFNGIVFPSEKPRECNERNAAPAATELP